MAGHLRVDVRGARAADAATLTAIAHAAKRHWGYPEPLIEMWRDALTVTAEAIATDVVRCAECDGRVVGFYAMSRCDAGGELEHMWVHPETMRRGVGRVLFADLRATLRELGVATVRIESDPNAEGFYRRMGACRVGEAESTPAGRRLPVLVLTP